MSPTLIFQGSNDLTGGISDMAYMNTALYNFFCKKDPSSFPAFFQNLAGFYIQRLLYFRVNTSCMGNYEEKQRWLPNSHQVEGKQTVYGAFSPQ